MGESFYISKVKVILPWWSGSTINNGRTYDWDVLYSDNNSGYTQIYTTGPNNRIGAAVPKVLYLGDSGFEPTSEDFPDSIQSRYWKLNINNTHAFYNSASLVDDWTDEWDWECAGTNIWKGESRESPFLGEGGVISKNELTPPNDCYASAVELGFYRKILPRDTITSVSYKQIQNDNRQITYYHVPEPDEMLSPSGSTRKYEPGSTF